MGIIARILDQPAERIAVRAGQAAVSFGRLAADVAAAAAQLQGEGVGPGKVVGIRAGNAASGHSYANWVAHLAAMKLGAAHVSMTDPAAVRATLRTMSVDCVVGSFELLLDVPPGVRKVQFHADPARPMAAPAPGAWAEAGDAEGLAKRLNLTSGTTGKPRFVAWDAGLIEGRVEQVMEAGLVGPETRLYPLLHLRTTAGFRYPLAVWAAGGCVILPPAAKGLAREHEGVPASNLITCSPPQLRERLAGMAGKWPGREARTIILLGGRLPAAVRAAALERACSRLLVSYGSTETGSVALGDDQLIERHPGAVGMLRPGVEVEIVGPDGEPVAPGEPGLVRIRSPLMVAGYEAGAGTGGESRFKDGWFYPGDVGRLYDDKLLAIDGRAGDTLNLGGWKVLATDLETRVGQIAGVRDVCAVAMPLPQGDMLTFGIVCDDGIDFEALNQQVAALMMRRRPFRLIRMPAIPRNAMGKIPRPLIAARLAALYEKAAANA